MVLILVHHLYQHLYFSYDIGCATDSIFSKILLSIGYLGTGVFFLLSGYGLEKSFSKKIIDKSLVVGNLKKLILPYLYACIIYVLISQDISIFGKGWFYKVIILIYIISFVVY